MRRSSRDSEPRCSSRVSSRWEALRPRPPQSEAAECASIQPGREPWKRTYRRICAFHVKEEEATMASTTEVQEQRPLLDTLQAIRTRRAVKEYLDKPIPKEWIEELLDAAHWAPNHKLTHPWRFHVFSGEGRERLVAAREAATRWGFQQKGQETPPEQLEFARQK